MRKLVPIVCVLLSLATARAQTPTCDSLDAGKKKIAHEILSGEHPYDCCDGTILECLQEKQVCTLAWRLAENVCRRVKARQDQAKIKRGLSRRARSMLPSGKKAEIDLEGVPVAGADNAPVTAVMYACARCPFCAKITPELHAAVTEGPLKGKVKLCFKVFPIRSHEHSKETGLGFMAAAKLNKFWDFVMLSFDRFDAFCMDKQRQWAQDAGLDADAFARIVSDPATRERLVASKKEGIVNKVDATPTFFINGRKFVGDLDLAELIDVLEEEHERVQGFEYRQ